MTQMAFTNPLTGWRPALSAFLATLDDPPVWGVDLDAPTYGKGIDNAHLDVYLNAEFRDQVSKTVGKLIMEDVLSFCRNIPAQLVSASDFSAFREAYAGLFETEFERRSGKVPTEILVLLQLSLLKWLLHLVAEESQHLQEELKSAGQSETVRARGQNIALHDQLVVLSQQEQSINRRVLHLLFRHMRKVEAGSLRKLLAASLGREWPFPEAAYFNPVLLASGRESIKALSTDYPAAAMVEDGGEERLQQTASCLVEAMGDYLPPWVKGNPKDLPGRADGSRGGDERRDQGLLDGFLGSELLLSRFVPREEYLNGLTSWLDEPANMRRLLADDDELENRVGRSAKGAEREPGWREFRQGLRHNLFLGLERAGLTDRILMLYWMGTIRTQLGSALPMSTVVEYMEGYLSKRRVGPRLAALKLNITASDFMRVVDRNLATMRKLQSAQRWPYYARWLHDFVTFRRDLKLAFKTHEAMDRIRLLEDRDDALLSRSNGTLYEFAEPLQTGPAIRRVRCHAVVKADVRGSTRITEELCARGLNPASHFSLNLFNPVNRLLAEYGAEKIFVEGDAVILAFYEHEGEKGCTPVARASGLARKILQVVALQNVFNRKHGLPTLELGLGIAFSPREPNFLYDEGRKIMISEAINRADRLSGSAATLRRSGFEPKDPAFRVAVVSDAVIARTDPTEDDLLAFNVDGVRLEEPAFFKLQRELRLTQVHIEKGDPRSGLYFVGRYEDAAGRRRRIAVRCSTVRVWDGEKLIGQDPEKRHYFEVIVDESLSAYLRKQAKALEQQERRRASRRERRAEDAP